MVKVLSVAEKKEYLPIFLKRISSTECFIVREVLALFSYRFFSFHEPVSSSRPVDLDYTVTRLTASVSLPSILSAFSFPLYVPSVLSKLRPRTSPFPSCLLVPLAIPSTFELCFVAVRILIPYYVVTIPDRASSSRVVHRPIAEFVIIVLSSSCLTHFLSIARSHSSHINSEHLATIDR